MLIRLSSRIVSSGPQTLNAVDLFTSSVGDFFPLFIFTYSAVYALESMNCGIGKDKLRETVGTRTA